MVLAHPVAASLSTNRDRAARTNTQRSSPFLVDMPHHGNIASTAFAPKTSDQ
jgi:hypothetical protein